jgi:three-Cys-motif partner protein
VRDSRRFLYGLLHLAHVASARSRNVIVDRVDDGLPCLPLKDHSRAKLDILGYYLAEFTRAMASKFPTLVYLDLFAGPGRGRFERSGEFIDGSPLIAARTKPPFKKMILVEEDRGHAAALRERLRLASPECIATIFEQNCNTAVDDIRREIPRFSQSSGGLTFCLIDPFDLGIEFATIKAFSDLRVDFLVLIADQMAGGRNVENYLRDDNETVSRFLDDSDWRPKWKVQEVEGVAFREFLVAAFSDKMKTLNFLAGDPYRVAIAGNNVPLYVLVLFSKHRLAMKFWDSALRNAPRQKSFW